MLSPILLLHPPVAVPKVVFPCNLVAGWKGGSLHLARINNKQPLSNCLTHHEVFLHEGLGIRVLLHEISLRRCRGHGDVIINQHASGSEDALPLDIVSFPSEGRGQSHTSIGNLHNNFNNDRTSG